ncbi:hypothetical protein CYMTET_16398, partial [Cymbomonas tetramitiformis]
IVETSSLDVILRIVETSALVTHWVGECKGKALEERLRRAQGDAEESHTALVKCRSECAKAVSAKEVEVKQRLMQLETSTSSWPSHIRQRTEEAEADLAKAQDELVEIRTAMQKEQARLHARVVQLEEQLVDREEERTKAMAENRRQIGDLEGALQIMNEARVALQEERDNLQEEIELEHSKPRVESTDRSSMEGVDVLYLKNVVIKFLEEQATTAGMALLPVIATLLQFTPEEFKRTQTAMELLKPPATASGAGGWGSSFGL